MKLTAALVLLVLGLASARTLDVEDSISEDLFDSDEIDFEIDDDVSLDEVRAKWRLIRNMYQVIEDMEESQGELLHKRFIDSWWKKIKEPFVKAAKKVASFFKDTYEKAAAAFRKVSTKLDFKKIVNKLVTYIHSGMTVKACSKICVHSAKALLGSAAGSAGSACGPLCNGALAKLEEIAG